MPYTPTRWRVSSNLDGSYSIARGAIEYTCVDKADAQFLADVLNLHSAIRDNSRPSLERIFEAAAAYWNVPLPSIMVTKRQNPFQFARKAAITAAYSLGYNFNQIGQFLDRHPTGVEHHVRDGVNWARMDPKFASDYNNYLKTI